MSDETYTLGAWRAKDGKQAEFVEAWRELGRYFRSLPHPPGQGMLLQSVDDPQQFYSFGPWRSLDDIKEMRDQPETAKEMAEVMDLCEEGHPGAYRLVATA